MPGRAIGASTAWQRVPSASRTSTNGLASSRRRPPRAARRCASRRTAASSANRTSARSQPLARSTKTPSVPLTRTSVTPGSRSSGSSGPAPRTSRRSTSCTASTVASPTGRPEARSASATRWAVSAPGRSARRSRTSSTTTASSTGRSTGAAVMPRGAAAPGRRAPRGRCGRADRAATAPARARGRSPPRGHAGRPSARRPGPTVSRATASARTRSPRTHQPQRLSGRGTAAHRRTADASPATVGTVSTNTRSQRATSSSTNGSTLRGRSTTTVWWPRWAGGDARCGRRRPGGCPAAGVPGQHAEPVAPRQGVAQRAPAEPAGGLAERVPADAVVPVEPEDPVDARPERVGVDDDGGPRPGRHLAQRAGERRGAGAARAADHADRHRAVRAGVADVGHQLDDPAGRPGQLGDVLGAERERRTEHVVGHAAAPHEVHARPTRRRQPGQRLGQVDADEDQRGGVPGVQRAPPGHAPGRASRPPRRPAAGARRGWAGRRSRRGVCPCRRRFPRSRTHPPSTLASCGDPLQDNGCGRQTGSRDPGSPSPICRGRPPTMTACPPERSADPPRPSSTSTRRSSPGRARSRSASRSRRAA